MNIVDLDEQYFHSYFCCLEEWSEDMKEAGDHKERWFHTMKDKGLRVKIAVENNTPCGMIQYEPIEFSLIQGHDLYFIKCIWVHGYKEGVGNFQKRGIGTALLQAAEEDVKSMNRKGLAAWGIGMPFWMKASWFKKHGYKKVDKYGVAVLLWKPFSEEAQPPRWIRQKKRPEVTPGNVTVTSFINGWCPAQNIVHERAKRAAGEFGDAVIFRAIHTDDRATFNEWGVADALFINDKQINTGPPPSYDKLRRKIAKAVKRL